MAPVMKDLDKGWYRWRRLVSPQESSYIDEWCEVTVKFPLISIWPARKRVLEENFSQGDPMIRQRHESWKSIEWEGGKYQIRWTNQESLLKLRKGLASCPFRWPDVCERRWASCTPVLWGYCWSREEVNERDMSTEINSDLWFFAPSASALPSCSSRPNSCKIDNWGLITLHVAGTASSSTEMRFPQTYCTIHIFLLMYACMTKAC